jgi:hypothetical protein
MFIETASPKNFFAPEERDAGAAVKPIALLRSSEVFPALLAINIWPLCGQDADSLREGLETDSVLLNLIVYFSKITLKPAH